MGPDMLRALLNICFLLFPSLHFDFTDSSSANKHPLCHEEESDALLQFKHGFSINKITSADNPSAYPKTESWNVRRRGGGDCSHCSWDGVQCHPSTGRVIGLDLSGSCLYGSIDSTSTLFHLVHLRRLNLAFNDFKHSKIPSALGILSRLTHLNLSHSSFSGQIPLQVLELSKLVLLDLSGSPTELVSPGFGRLLQNLTSLNALHLSEVSIGSMVPDILANSSSLTSLDLRNCGLHGKFPMDIFHLPNLRYLSLRANPDLTGLLPEFRKSSPLQELILGGSGFSGKVPSSIGNLNCLIQLDISNCGFSGSIPASMANLTQIKYLSLSYNDFNSQNLQPWLGKLSKLTVLEMEGANLKGELPPSLANLTQLNYLSLDSNQLTGQLPYWLANLTHLIFLDISQNKLQGPIPDSVFQMAPLEYLNLFGNNLSGTVELDKFMELKNLIWLDLSDNKLSVLTNTNLRNATFRKWKTIALSSCNLSKFPDFLNGQNEMEWLQLERNNLHGSIPKWIWNTSTKTLAILVLGNNSFTGNLPLQLCSLTSLNVLDVSHNNLSGTIPPCIWSFSNNLSWLNLKGNNFHGIIPQTLKSGNQLRAIDLSKNRLQGQLPRSLANCTMLVIFDISNNQIKDNFPYWLGILPDLSILVLRSNRFHGILGGVRNENNFPKLRIIDLSYNGFFGNIPAEYFQTWNAMKVSNRQNPTYLVSRNVSDGYSFWMMYSTWLTIKGVASEYPQFLRTFAVIDLSCNSFNGAIPESIADLKGLHLLNLSNNYFTGPIPSSLGNYTELESLDLSQNKLSGQIPVELVQLTFLGLLNVSYNNLSGIIPHGNQFDTFSNTSFLGNLGLCGNPLSKKCGTSETLMPPPTTLEEGENTESGFEFDWVVISMGYVSGLVVGVVIGCTLAARKHEWLVETFGRKQRRHIERR